MRWTDIATVQIHKFIREQRSNINGSNKRAMDDGKRSGNIRDVLLMLYRDNNQELNKVQKLGEDIVFYK